MAYLKRLTYQRKLLLFSLFLCMAPVLLIGVAASSIASRSLQDEVDAHQLTALKIIQVQVDNLIDRMEQISLSLAGNPIVLRSADTGVSTDNIESSLQLMDLLQNTVLNSNIPFDVSLIMTKFGTVYSHRMGVIRSIDYPLSEVVKLSQLPNNRVFKIPPNTYTNQKDMLVVRTVPINSPQPRAILVLQLSAKQLQELITQTDLPGNRKIYLVDDQNRLMAGDPNGKAEGVSSSEPISALIDSIHQSEDLPEQVEFAGEPYFVTSLKSALNGWTYIAMTPLDEINRKSYEIQAITWFTVVVIALIWGLLAVLGSNRLFLPLQRLFAKPFSKEQGSDIVIALNTYMNDMRTANERLQAQLIEQSYVMKEHVLLQLIRGEPLTGALLEEGGIYFSERDGKWFAVGVVEIDSMPVLQQTFVEQDTSLMLQALRKLIEETGAELGHSVLSASPKQGQAVFILGLSDEAYQAEAAALNYCSAIRSKVSDYFPYTVSIFLGGPREGVEQIRLTYEEAVSLLQYRWAMEPNGFLSAKDIRSSDSLSGRLLVKKEQEIVAHLTRGEFDTAKERLQELVLEASGALRSSDTVRGLFAHLLGELDNLLLEPGVNLNDLLGGTLLAQWNGLKSIYELQTWMGGTVFTVVQDHMNSLQIPKKKKVVDQTVAAIRSHFETDLSLQVLADQLYVTPKSLSKWFKEETGEYFADYLIRFRMERAKEWLIHSEMPVKEMAERLRYTSVQNFTRIFKQTIGVPPSSFRSQSRE